MKRLMLCTFVLLLTTSVFGQKKITEGRIIYSVEWLPNPQMQQFAAMFPTELTVYFKGDSSVTVSKSAFSNTKFILNEKTEYQRLLIDIPMNGKKYSVIFTPDDQELMKENAPEFSSTVGTETKSIADYKVQKYSMSEKKSGSKSEAWFTKDIIITKNSLNQFYDASLGFPMEFNSFQNGMALKAKVKEIKEETIPSGIFSASKDYEEITFAQLMGMMGAGRR